MLKSEVLIMREIEVPRPVTAKMSVDTKRSSVWQMHIDILEEHDATVVRADHEDGGVLLKVGTCLSEYTVSNLRRY
jgi:hypothetical protein